MAEMLTLEAEAIAEGSWGEMVDILTLEADAIAEGPWVE